MIYSDGQDTATIAKVILCDLSSMAWLSRFPVSWAPAGLDRPPGRLRLSEAANPLPRARGRMDRVIISLRSNGEPRGSISSISQNTSRSIASASRAGTASAAVPTAVIVNSGAHASRMRAPTRALFAAILRITTQLGRLTPISPRGSIQHY